jgi:hypothetical protein
MACFYTKCAWRAPGKAIFAGFGPLSGIKMA